MKFIHFQPFSLESQRIIIEGILHIDYASNPSSASIVTFLKGGIAESSVTINVLAPPGNHIDSKFSFFTSHRCSDSPTPKALQDYIEVEIDPRMD